MAALALKLVPNCSALIVMYTTDIPEAKPSPMQSAYIFVADPPPFVTKNKSIKILSNP